MRQRRESGQLRARAFALFEDIESLTASFERRSARRRRGEHGAPLSPPAGPTAVGVRDLCHDLRQPVAALDALAAGLEDEEGLSAEGQERLGRLREQAQRLSALVAQFLQPPPPVLVHLPVLARQAVAAARHLVRAPVELALDERAVVAGDPVLLSRVLVNLLQNADEAVASNGRVQLTVGCVDSEVLVTVEDSGGGPRRTSSGHGLGLTIVQAVVAAHGGRVDSEPSALGGLRVQVHLPRVLPRQADP